MVKDIFPASFDFIEEHILDIILVILLLFCLAIYIVLNNIKFPKSHPSLQKVVILENFHNKTNICKGNLMEKNKACESLSTKDSCGVDCCVWAKKKKSKNFSCLGGDEGGSTYDGHDYDAYYYKNKRYPAAKSKPVK
jgi:hypothetical protein